MNVSKEVERLLSKTIEFAKKNHHEYITPEHLLYTLTFEESFRESFEQCGGNVDKLKQDLLSFLSQNIEIVELGEPEFSVGFGEIIMRSQNRMESCDKYIMELPHIIASLLDLDESFAKYYIEVQGVNSVDLIYEICEKMDSDEAIKIETMYDEKEKGIDKKTKRWKEYVECLNDNVDNMNPLIGRHKELERTIQILCRKDKNNPLHIGEAGVGKTAITYGLARLLNEDKVPDVLKGAKIYAIDLGNMLAGTQYRGDFEKRFKNVMKGIAKEENPIVYLDEIHNIIGAGAVNGASFDVSNMLKPYLAEGKIRFIGATTYEEYKKYFSKSKSLVRRFQNIDIKEPNREETFKILEGLKQNYEDFHHVKYGKNVLEYAITLSDKYINERYLPDKAIDLIDEAGAYRQIHPTDKKVQTVDKKLIDEILSKSCNIPRQTIESDEIKKIAVLDKHLKSKIFGQDEAIAQVVNAVKLSRAGLLEDGKPLASLLFVGPTGVGKTEVAKVLSQELGIKLIRFDMSEYTERHAVAKLIGSPAGYVGYEEGGLLTEEVRKTPQAVLLLDEIEKAHPDIYNILLQVMDYATLTDNQGKKADFRNIILIMTSNAGADKLSKEQIGFGKSRINSDAMMTEVKRIFQPEFRNRLSKIVMFNEIDEKMALSIIQKKLSQLGDKLSQKNVQFTFSKQSVEAIKKKGVKREYGAREIDRVINNEIKPLLVDILLFGKLKKGGRCMLNYDNEKFYISVL